MRSENTAIKITHFYGGMYYIYVYIYIYMYTYICASSVRPVWVVLDSSLVLNTLIQKQFAKGGLGILCYSLANMERDLAGRPRYEQL